MIHRTDQALRSSHVAVVVAPGAEAASPATIPTTILARSFVSPEPSSRSSSRRNRLRVCGSGRGKDLEHMLRSYQSSSSSSSSTAQKQAPSLCESHQQGDVPSNENKTSCLPLFYDNMEEETNDVDVQMEDDIKNPNSFLSPNPKGQRGQLGNILRKAVNIVSEEYVVDRLGELEDDDSIGHAMKRGVKATPRKSLEIARRRLRLSADAVTANMVQLDILQSAPGMPKEDGEEDIHDIDMEEDYEDDICSVCSDISEFSIPLKSS